MRSQNPLFGKSQASLCLWILLACLVAYANIYGNQFVWDDLDFIVKNYEVRSLFPLSKFFLSTSSIPQRPIMNLSFALDYRFWGLNPAGYHLTQILLHAAVSILVFLLLYRLLGSFGAAFLSGLLFAVHPVHSEAVAAFLGRSDLTMTFFTLLALEAFLYCLRHSGLKGWIGYGGSLVAYALACLSKETGIVFPFLLLTVAGLSPFPKAERRPWKGFLLRLLPFVAVAFLYLLYRHSVVRPIVRSWWGGGPAQSLWMMFTVVWEYARLLVFPLHLSPWYITRIPGSFWEWKVILGVFILVGLFALAVLLRRKSWLLSLGIGWVLLALLPVSNLVPIPGSMMAERWLYLPSVGFSWLLGWLLSRGYEQLRGRSISRFLLLGSLVLIGLLFLLRTWKANAIWRNGETLFPTMLARNDANPLAHNHLGDLYLEQGRYEKAGREYAVTLFYQPSAPRAYEGLGSVLWAQGLRGEALTDFRKAVVLDPDFTQAHYSLGLALSEIGDTIGAIREIQWVLDREPFNPAPNEAVGTLLLGTGRPQESLKFFEQALTMRPKDAGLHFKTGQACAALDRWAMAENSYLRALALDPRFEKAYVALLSLYERQGRTAEAEALRKKYRKSIAPGR